MNRIFIALGSQEKFARLGDFNVTVNGEEVDLYFNLDLGDHRTSMFDIDSGTYKNLAKAHHSFHYSGRGTSKRQQNEELVPFSLAISLMEVF